MKGAWHVGGNGNYSRVGEAHSASHAQAIVEPEYTHVALHMWLPDGSQWSHRLVGKPNVHIKV